MVMDMDASLPPQFFGGGQTLVVKNTFIDFPAPQPDFLYRSQTAPPECSYGPDGPGESSSSSASGDETGDVYGDETGDTVRTQDFEQVRAPMPERKMSEEEVSDLGQLAKAEDFQAWTDKESLGRSQKKACLESAAAPAKPAEASVTPSSVSLSASCPAQERCADDAASQLGEDIMSSTDGPQPQTLACEYLASRKSYQVIWTVDARKLKGNDKQAVSPPFDLAFGLEHPSVTFKMMIYPRAQDDAKGGASFKKSKGIGFIQLKCEGDLSADVASVSFELSVGNALQGQSAAKGPVRHNFAQSAVCGLPKTPLGNEDWNFLPVVDNESMTFNVYLNLLPEINAPPSMGHRVAN